MGKTNSETGSSGIGVIDKSVAVLAAVATAPRSLADLVGATGLPRATAHRLAVALELHRLLARDAAGRFVLGARIGEFAAALPDPVVVAAGPVLTWVRDEIGESAQLYRLDGTERVCVAAAERTQGLRTTVPVGTRLPLTAGSGAQVLTAFAAPATHAGPPAFSERSLAEVRRRGWAQSIAQREAGVASVSAPVLSPEGDLLGAISISGPIERLGRSPGTRCASVLVEGARRITAALAS
ncbi:IclR family transcriptional regulator [Jatrophihabitans endophyticus]|uniref:IclR family transcriptional regulator n=1 Tax=Jatrophihabitans endophyticus TaxID=1206085 RepID=UPI001A0B114F|nr:IclR family transcriptional regulator [Jatrophihabitans endophyticus]MBE7188791.1 IclR family transcriptional regulator [Jatrophihabitans endophyticus]